MADFLLNALDALGTCSGRWTGLNRLSDPSQNVLDESQSTATVTPLLGGAFIRMDYTWAYQDAPQEGSLLIGYDSGAEEVTAHWIDTWHMGERAMLLSGTPEDDGSIAVRGSYAAPPGPDWGWRIVLQPENDSALHLLMYNITPDGAEALAVETDYTPLPGC